MSLNTQAPAASASSHLESTFPTPKKKKGVMWIGRDVREPPYTGQQRRPVTASLSFRGAHAVSDDPSRAHIRSGPRIFIPSYQARRNEQIAESIISHVHHPAMPDPGSSPTKAGRRRSSGQRLTARLEIAGPRVPDGGRQCISSLFRRQSNQTQACTSERGHLGHSCVMFASCLRA